MLRRRYGFTLIELLVVIAIIGILASMVFPVFARARESARKAVCLSNVKNISLAIQMYLSDNNDTMPPSEHRQDVRDYLGAMSDDSEFCQQSLSQIFNPYLQMPVVLDEYVKNRDVWNCPSAKLVGGARFIYPHQDWVSYLFVEHPGEWGGAYGSSHDCICLAPCFNGYPRGWGGTVTDSIVQDRMATYIDQRDDTVDKAFFQSVGFNTLVTADMKLAEVDDTVNYVIVCDSGANDYNNLGTWAYPDICQAECAVDCASWADWSEPLQTNYPPGDGSFFKDPDVAKRFTRHLGGINVGFLDGHAEWMLSQTFITKYAEGELEGIVQDGPDSTCGIYEVYPEAGPTIF